MTQQQQAKEIVKKRDLTRSPITEGIRQTVHRGTILHTGERMQVDGEIMTLVKIAGDVWSQLLTFSRDDGTTYETSKYSAAMTQIDNRYQTADVIEKRNGPPWA